MTDDADAKLADMIERLRAVPKALDAVAAKLAPAVQTYLAECYRRGVDPDGEQWAPLKKTGGKPDITGSELAVVAIGRRVIVKVSGHDALHSLGWGRGGTIRRLVPAGAIPAPLAARMRAIVDAEIKAALGART